MDPTTFIGKFVDYAGGVIRTPGRLLTTADELFKTVFYRGELNAQAYRRAVQEGHQGDALFKRVSELVDDPLPEISGAAMDAARKGTFTSPIANEGFTGAALKVSQHPVGRYLLPFVRTPVNIIKYVGERTPVLRGMSDHVKADLAAGGARKDLAQARMVMGSGLFTIGAVLTASGVIQGGGEINKTAEQMNGWIPYSIKIGDSYYAYNRLDPIGMFLGLAADFTEISGHLDDKTAGELTSAFVLALNRNLASKTYLKGIFDLTNALTEEQRGNSGAFVRWMNNFGSSFMPFSSMSNAVRREVDPEVKEVWDLMDAYKSKIPGFSKDVLPQVNMFGEDVVYKDGLGPDIASPIMTSDAVSDVAATEIARLNIDLKSPPKKLTPVDGAPGIDLNQEQYYKLKKFMGTEFKTNVTKIIESPAYQNLPENLDNVGYKQSKVQVIQMVHAKAREVAVYKLLKEYPELAQAHKQLFINKGLAMRGQPVVPILAQQ
jgi:hypothetical protein